MEDREENEEVVSYLKDYEHNKTLFYHLVFIAFNNLLVSSSQGVKIC